jgi:hypothetical protein
MGAGKRTEYRAFAVRAADWLTAVGLIVVAAASVYLRLLDYGELLDRM